MRYQYDENAKKRNDILPTGAQRQVKDQHKKITGYRDLTEDEIAMMNDIKRHGAELEDLVECLRGVAEFDQRWVEEGTMDLQKGIMALVRAVAQPDSF